MSGTVELAQFPLEKELKKNSLISPRDVEKLRQWLNTQTHLPADHITDLDLILTYHCCSRSAEVSKQVLDLHFTLKTLFTNFFKDRVVDDKILKILSFYLFEPLPVRAYDESAILYARMVNYDPKNFTFSEAVRGVFMILDLWQYSEGTWPGFVIIIDLDSITMSHITRFAQELTSLQQLLYFVQEALLLSLKGVHFLNAPSFMDRIMMLLKPFMKKELLDMVSIHQVGSRTIDKFLPIEEIPKDDTLEQRRDKMIEKIKANAAFFTEENKKRVVESCRAGKPKTISDIFGSVEGSFKKLDID